MDPSLLRRCYESGDFEPLRKRYAQDARFDALVPGRRVQLTGPDAIVAQLAAWWPRPGELLRWHVDEYATGLTVEFEREVAAGRVWRQRQFLSARRREDRSPPGLFGAPAQRGRGAAAVPTCGAPARRRRPGRLRRAARARRAGGRLDRACDARGRSNRGREARCLRARPLSRVAGLHGSIEGLLWQSVRSNGCPGGSTPRSSPPAADADRTRDARRVGRAGRRHRATRHATGCPSSTRSRRSTERSRAALRLSLPAAHVPADARSCDVGTSRAAKWPTSRR